MRLRCGQSELRLKDLEQSSWPHGRRPCNGLWPARLQAVKVKTEDDVQFHSSGATPHAPAHWVKADRAPEFVHEIAPERQRA